MSTLVELSQNITQFISESEITGQTKNAVKPILQAFQRFLRFYLLKSGDTS
jgi:hypothetical protein